MKNQWYCGVEGQQYGPYTWEQMRAMAEEGRLVSESYVRREVDPQWLTASQVPGLLKKKTKAVGATSTQVSAAAVSKAVKVAAEPVPPPIAEGNGQATAPSVASNGHATESKRSAAKIPRGQPLPASPPPVAAPIPVGVAVAPSTASGSSFGPAGSSGGFSLQTAKSARPAKSAKWRTDDEEAPEPVKKKSNALLIVGVLAGVVLLVGATGVVLLIWSGMRAAARLKQELQAAAEQVAAAVPTPAGEANPSGGEANPITPELPPGENNPVAVPAVAAAPPPANGKVAPPVARSADSAAAAKVVKSVSSWMDVTRTPGIKMVQVKLEVASAWLAADESGARVEPASGTAGGAKYVFVEMRLTNLANAPRPYTSWNATAGTSAVMADAGGQPLTLVPATATPTVNRLSRIDIPAGKVMTDTLVFPAPAGSVEKLRLALAKAALAGNARTTGTHFAFEIPLEILERGSPMRRPAIDPAAAPGDGPLSANQTPPIGGAAVPPAIVETPQPPTPAAPAPTPQPPPPPALPKFDPKEFDKSLKDEDKKGTEPAGKTDKPEAAPKADSK